MNTMNTMNTTVKANPATVIKLEQYYLDNKLDLLNNTIDELAGTANKTPEQEAMLELLLVKTRIILNNAPNFFSFKSTLERKLYLNAIESLKAANIKLLFCFNKSEAFTFLNITKN